MVSDMTICYEALFFYLLAKCLLWIYMDQRLLFVGGQDSDSTNHDNRRSLRAPSHHLAPAGPRGWTPFGHEERILFST
jgi:hypothetical protein